MFQKRFSLVKPDQVKSFWVLITDLAMENMIFITKFKISIVNLL